MRRTPGTPPAAAPPPPPRSAGPRTPRFFSGAAGAPPPPRAPPGDVPPPPKPRGGAVRLSLGPARRALRGGRRLSREGGREDPSDRPPQSIRGRRPRRG